LILTQLYPNINALPLSQESSVVFTHHNAVQN